MDDTSTHLFVPTVDQRASCLGPDGAVVDVSRVIRMIQGRWKLPILFRLYPVFSIRTLQLKRSLPNISQKILTQTLNELVVDRLIERIDFNEKPLRVEYRLSSLGRDLMPVLISAREFSVKHSSIGNPLL